ncbi:MAG: glycerol-3-phosphate acyltransferase [Chloroflexi bacterium]|nr:glycerol-3-phosphate acyltransferase [Chloroflexota bacterium]
MLVWAITGAAAVGYLLGSIPTAWIVTRHLSGKRADIRALGDRNMGATNVGRLFSRRWGILVGAVDISKGLAAAGIFLLISDVVAPGYGDENLHYLVVVSGIGAMVGHIWPIWLRFRGGRGAATAVGVIGAMILVPMLILALPTALILARNGNTSLAFGFIVLWSNVIAKVFFDSSWDTVIFSFGLFVLVVLTDPRLRIIRQPNRG